MLEKEKLIRTVEDAKQGSQYAREILYKEFYKEVLFICKKYGLTMEDAEDVTQEVFIKVFESLSSLEKNESFGGWISRIASNKCLNLIKHNSIIQMNSMDDEESSMPELPAKEKNAQEIVEDKEVSELLQKIIEELPLEQKLVVFMYYYQDYSVAEIAKEFECPDRTIRSRLAYAKKHLRKKVEAMENEGIKLRSIAMLPFLYVVFSGEKEVFASTITTIPKFAGISGGAVAAIADVAAQTGSGAVNGSNAASTTADVAAQTGSSAVNGSNAASTTADVAAKVAASAVKKASKAKIAGIIAGVTITAGAAGFGGNYAVKHLPKNDTPIETSSENKLDSKEDDSYTFEDVYYGVEDDKEYTMSKKEYSKEYDERMEAYIEYFDDYMYDYPNANTAISLDRYGLPVMWVYSIDDSELDGREIVNAKYCVQLISYENDEATSLGEVEFEAYAESDSTGMSVNMNDEGIFLSMCEDYFIYYDDEDEKLLCTKYEEDTEYYWSNDSKLLTSSNIYECFGMSKEEYIRNHFQITKALNTSYLMYLNRDTKEVSYLAKKEQGNKENAIDFMYSLGALEKASNSKDLYILSEDYVSDEVFRELFKKCFETDVDKMPKECQETVREIITEFNEIREMSDEELKEFLSENDMDRDTLDEQLDCIENEGIGYWDRNVESEDYEISVADNFEATKNDIEELEKAVGNINWHSENSRFFEEESGKEYLSIVADVKPCNAGELGTCIYRMKYDADIIKCDNSFLRKLVIDAETEELVDKLEGKLDENRDEFYISDINNDGKVEVATKFQNEYEFWTPDGMDSEGEITYSRKCCSHYELFLYENIFFVEIRWMGTVYREYNSLNNDISSAYCNIYEEDYYVDSTPEAEYYIADEPVSKQEFNKYVETLTKKKPIFIAYETEAYNTLEEACRVYVEEKYKNQHDYLRILVNRNKASKLVDTFKDKFKDKPIYTLFFVKDVNEDGFADIVSANSFMCDYTVMISKGNSDDYYSCETINTEHFLVYKNAYKCVEPFKRETSCVWYASFDDKSLASYTENYVFTDDGLELDSKEYRIEGDLVSEYEYNKYTEKLEKGGAIFDSENAKMYETLEEACRAYVESNSK